MSHFKIAALIVATCALAGCATTRDEFTTIYESARLAAGDTKKTLTSDEALVMLRSISPYADMAEAVYRHDLRESWQRLEQSCDYVGWADAPPLRVGLPDGWFRLDKKMMVRLGMESAVPAAPLRPCRAGKGLEYETYVKLDQVGQPLQATISFRGTENTKYEWRSDWIANFSNVDFGVGGNSQFKEARQEGLRLIKALAGVLPRTKPSDVCAGQPRGAQVPIDLVGHSLGGGLAQHLAFSANACDVRSTVVFDPSPATGWFYLYFRKDVETKDPIIHRIYLDGEVLSFVRKVTTQFNTPRENRRDIRIVFSGVDAGAFGRHNMNLFAQVIKIAASGPVVDDPGRHVDYASTEVHSEVLDANRHRTSGPGASVE